MLSGKYALNAALSQTLSDYHRETMMIDQYDINIPIINGYLVNVFSEFILTQNSTIRKFQIFRQEGER